MCNCKKPKFDYVGKMVKVNEEWYQVFTEDRMKGNIGILIEGQLNWIRPSRIQDIRIPDNV